MRRTLFMIRGGAGHGDTPAMPCDRSRGQIILRIRCMFEECLSFNPERKSKSKLDGGRWRRSRPYRSGRLAISVAIAAALSQSLCLRIFHRAALLFQSLRQRLSILLLLGGLVRLLSSRPRTIATGTACYAAIRKSPCRFAVMRYFPSGCRRARV
jgi:hypothetical protein